MIVWDLLVVGTIALATLRRYFLVHTATITSLALFLSTGLNSVSAAPSYSLGFSPTADTYNTMESWEQPCGTPLNAGLKRPPQRHSVHRALKRVRTQLRVAQNHFRKELIDVHNIYSKVSKVLKGQYHMNWLPKNQIEWYYNELWCMEKSKKAEYALPKLHDALQRFAITFHSLRRFRLKSNINADHTVRRRNEIVGGMQNEILRTLCEVETAILNLGFQLPSVYNTKIVTESQDWAAEGDLTLMLIQDWGILRLYQIFLNDWTRAFRNATATGPGTCDPKTVIPLLNRQKKTKTRKSTRLRSEQPIKKRSKLRGPMKNEISSSVNNNSTHLRKKGVKRRLMKNRRRKL